VKLTHRQRQVVELLATGASCPAIARRLGVSISTVRAHVRAIAALLQRHDDVPALRLIRQNARKLLEAA